MTRFISFYTFNFDFRPKPYLVCETPCKNPFFNVEKCQQQLTILFFIPLYTTEDCREDPANDWILEENLPAGTYGKPPPKILKMIPWVVVAMFLMGFLLNHFAHNRGSAFDIEIPITKNRVINRDTFKKWSEDEKR